MCYRNNALYFGVAVKMESLDVKWFEEQANVHVTSHRRTVGYWFVRGLSSCIKHVNFKGMYASWKSEIKKWYKLLFLMYCIKSCLCSSLSTVEPRYNELLYNEGSAITNDILQPRYNEPRYNEIPVITNKFSFFISGLHCTNNRLSALVCLLAIGCP